LIEKLQKRKDEQETKLCMSVNWKENRRLAAKETGDLVQKEVVNQKPRKLLTDGGRLCSCSFISSSCSAEDGVEERRSRSC